MSVPVSRDAEVVNVAGVRGGRLVVGITAEPKSFNWVTANDSASRQVTYQLMADLVHVNRGTQEVEPALAKSWEVSADGRSYTFHLRQDVKFSDGRPFSADDVVFTYQVFLDPKVNSTQRSLLIIDGKEPAVEKLDAYTVRFTFPRAHGPALRAFDVIGILPRHLLESAYHEGRFSQVWTMAEDIKNIVGLGPFRLKQVVPGQRVVLEANPYYWKVDRDRNVLPYLDELDFEIFPDQNAADLQLVSGPVDLLDKISPDDFEFLKKSSSGGRFTIVDAGASLEYLFLVLNQNSESNPSTHKPWIGPEKLRWFSQVNFRRAVSSAMDRAAIVSLVYHGAAHEIYAQSSPGNKFWFNPQVSRYDLNLKRAQDLLLQAGFRVRLTDGALISPSGTRVAFTLTTNADNRERTRICTLLQADLAKLGISVDVRLVEFNALVGELLQTRDYEAALMGLGGGDSDPGGEMNVWLSSGPLHLWHLGEARPAAPWEARVDDLMKLQMSTTSAADRKRAFDEVQKIVSDELPIIPLVSRDILIAAKVRVQNLQPAVMAPYALWNSEQIYLKP
ncbi:MAG: ABC transporter substrate-binding protein [Acidobacteriia bacterium]|nr:ABC transporter substrate-binding protein [Terriglobia bacterium]